MTRNVLDGELILRRSGRCRAAVHALCVRDDVDRFGG
jgi:hypothetical protein